MISRTWLDSGGGHLVILLLMMIASLVTLGVWMKAGKETTEFQVTVLVIGGVLALALAALVTGQADSLISILDAIWKPIAAVALPYIGGRSYLKASQSND